MMNAEQVALLMLVLVPVILGICVLGYLRFMKWSRKDRAGAGERIGGLED